MRGMDLRLERYRALPAGIQIIALCSSGKGSSDLLDLIRTVYKCVVLWLTRGDIEIDKC